MAAKEKKRKYERECYKNLSEDQKQRIVENEKKKIDIMQKTKH